MFQLPFRPKPPAKEDHHRVQDSLTTPDDDNDSLNQTPSASTSIYGHDDASDTLLKQPPSPLDSTLESLSDNGSDHKDFSPPTPLISSPGASASSSSSSSSNASSPTTVPTSNLATYISQQSLLPLPTSAPGPVTHAHQVAMANRIELADLEPGGIFDPALYTPVFLHDTLMLPGSLANLLGKDSPLDILSRLTPARLPSYTALPHSIPPHIPCLIPSPTSNYTTGLVLFGTGRDARKVIKQHYRAVAKRKRLNVVVVEVKVPVPREERVDERERWRLESRRVVAQVFLWRGEGATLYGEGEWELGKFIAGAYGSQEEGINVVGAEKWGGAEGGEDEDVDDEVDGDEAVLRFDGRNEWTGPAVFGEGKKIDPAEIEW